MKQQTRLRKKSSIKAIILLGGEGERFEDPLPKQFHMLSGKHVFLYALETFCQIAAFDEILLVCHKDWIDLVKKNIESLTDERVTLCIGGKTRRASVYNGLRSLGNQTDFVVIHDGVRPFVSQSLIENHILLVQESLAVNTCIQTYDTINVSSDGKGVSEIPSRSSIYRGQTPQSFCYHTLFKAHEKISDEVTDDCSLVLKLGYEVAMLNGCDSNIKITSPIDLFIAEQLIRMKSIHLHIVEEDKPLAGKIYVVTGGRGGIGRRICESIVHAGGLPLSLSRNKSDLAVDVTNPKEIKESFAQIEKQFGKIDGLINCAGLLVVSELDALSDDAIQSQVDVNLTGMIYTCKYAPLIDNGHIINMGSSSYTRGRKLYGVYSSTKAAIVNFSQGLAEERGDLNVNVVVPSRTNTAMRKTNFPNEDNAHLLDPRLVADTVCEVLKRNQFSGNIVEVRKNVGPAGLEPATSSLKGKRSTN